MQSSYPESFEREMACTAGELVRWLPGASGSRPVSIDDGRAVVALGEGRLLLQWQQLPPRRIALITLPRLAVRFRFDGCADDERHAYMRHFDLYTQRGGG